MKASEVIKALEDGVVLECRHALAGGDIKWNEYSPLKTVWKSLCPQYIEGWEWRIKPKPIVRWIVVDKNNRQWMFKGNFYWTDEIFLNGVVANANVNGDNPPYRIVKLVEVSE